MKNKIGIYYILILMFTGTTCFVSGQDNANTKQRFAINFNEAMNRCLQGDCANLEEAIGFFSDDATYLDEASQLWVGKAEIRRRLSKSSAEAGVSDRIEGIDVAETMITLRLQRRRSFKTGKYDVTEVKPHLQVLVVKDGRISRLISIIPPEEKKK